VAREALQTAGKTPRPIDKRPTVWVGAADKKSNKIAIIFITIGVILFAVILIALVIAFSGFK